MRIIGGQQRGRTLRAPRGNKTRPTSDRVREALFSILQSRLGDLQGVDVLDLFAGSGALGLEAMSRGAEAAVLVDSAQAAVRAIRANAATLGYQDRCQVLAMAVPGALRLLQQQARSFHLIFIDPPYAMDTAALLPDIIQRRLLRAGGLLVLEHQKKTITVEPSGLARLMSRAYGDTGLTIYQMENS